MTKVIKELATGSIELGILATVLLMILSGIVAGYFSGGNPWWVIGAALFCLWVCRVIGRVCVGIEKDKTSRIRGGGWA